MRSLAFIALASCASPSPADETSSAAPAPVPAPAPSLQPSAQASASASAAPLKGSSPLCPGDMVLVEGGYCPAPSQVCLERPKVLGADGYRQCQRYAPSKCVTDKRTPMRFCMDRYEWPNKQGELPRTLVSWPEARTFCEGIGKRLCTEAEFNFACEGETMKPHVYGHERDPTACNFDRPYIERTFAYSRWDECMADPPCKAEYDRLDQRVPAGSMPRCVSDHGVYDLNGNVNEWVFRTDQRSPKRSGLKGGWWGPVRDRCRPMTTFHLEGDYGYEAGFRCCKDAQGTRN
jgi:sulfatase modifying factor 1